MKKFLSLVLALVMAMSLVTVSAGATDFADDADVTYDEAVSVISALGVVNGYADDTFKPTNNLTRQAAAKIICNLILGPTTAAELHADTAPFPDVPVTNDFAGYIAYCAKEGIIGGYADGNFRGGEPLTGYAFMKMLLGALGYDGAVEGYTGANWAINVAKQAIGIGLNAGLAEEFNGVDQVNREEACLYAFNTLKATMVEYPENSIINVGGAQVTLASARKDVSWGTGTKNDGNIDADGFVQFAERYFTKLSVTPDVDAFGRPTNIWVYDKEEIGEYVNWDLMVAEYTTSATGKELYEDIGKTAYDEYDFFAYVDGADSQLYKDISKNNKDDMGVPVVDGALTQVFVDKENEDVIITVINTYLAQAIADYNEKKDTATFKIFDLGNETVEGENFDIADVKEDDFVLVTYDAVEGEIVTIEDVEILSDVSITTFSTSGTDAVLGKATSITVDGTVYNDSAKLTYAAEVLDNYTDSNLKDTTFNVYLDKYGYVIGIDIVEAVKNYVFITGVDPHNSYLATANYEANALFLDGTSAVIDVKNNKVVDAGELVNTWCTYTVSKNGVYTLKAIENGTVGTAEDNKKNDTDFVVGVGQYHHGQGWNNAASAAGANLFIDSKNISLFGAKTDGADFRKVYGTDDTVYLLAELGNVNDTHTVIKGVDEVVTGIDNASFEMYGRDDAADVVGNTAGDNTVTSSGAYVLYDKDGDIIAAVVVGDSDSVTESIAYSHKGALADESYSSADETWTWTRKVIIDGEEVLLTETNDEDDSVLEDMVADTWYTVKYYADGTVKDVVAMTEANSDEYETTLQTVVTMIVNDKEETIVFDSDAVVEYVLKSKTLFDETNQRTGFRIAEDVKVVLIQTVKNKTTTTYYDGVKALDSVLNDLNEKDNKSDTDKGYNLDAVIENGRATSVIITDLNKDDGYGMDVDTTVDANVAKLEGKNNAGDPGVKVLLTTKVTEATDYVVELYMVNGGTLVWIDNVTVTAEAGNDYGWTALDSLASGQQYKVIYGTESALVVGK